MDQKAVLHDYLRRCRSDLLGLLKHVAFVQLGYFGEVFGRPSDRGEPWDDAAPNADMWATAEESREQIVELYRFSGEHADATIEALPLGAVGEVPWWPEERRHPSLHTVVVHMAVELARHAGHADILRETLDGASGRYTGDASIPGFSADEWAAYWARLEDTAQRFR